MSNMYACYFAFDDYYHRSLIMRGVFKEITLSCLPVGHTHEDIDQLFSRLTSDLKFNLPLVLGS